MINVSVSNDAVGDLVVFLEAVSESVSVLKENVCSREFDGVRVMVCASEMLRVKLTVAE